jgi:hypothetical protein
MRPCICTRSCGSRRGHRHSRSDRSRPRVSRDQRHLLRQDVVLQGRRELRGEPRRSFLVLPERDQRSARHLHCMRWDESQRLVHRDRRGNIRQAKRRQRERRLLHSPAGGQSHDRQQDDQGLDHLGSFYRGLQSSPRPDVQRLLWYQGRSAVNVPANGS